MNNKAEFNIQTYLIGILIFMGIVISLGGFATELSTTYSNLGGSNVAGDFVDDYDQIGDIESVTSSLEDKIITDTETGTDDSQSQFLGDVLASVKLIVPTLDNGMTMIYSAANDIGIGSTWTTIFISGIIILMLTTLIFMIFKNRG